MHKLLLSAVAVAALTVSVAQAAPQINVTTTMAPNGYGSPSYAAWVDNSIHAQINGLSAYGTAGTPTYYQAQSSVLATKAVATGFTSWDGVADPAAPFNFELGNRILGGLRIDGMGSQFAINALSVVMDSDDPGNALDYTFLTGSYNYSNDYRGVLKGNDNQLWTLDDIFITGGPNTQLVDGLVGRGSGNILAAYCPGCDTAAKQAAIDSTVSYFNQYAVTNFDITYSLGDVTGTGRMQILGAVPEPSSWALMILGFGSAGAMIRRRRQDLVAA